MFRAEIDDPLSRQECKSICDHEYGVGAVAQERGERNVEISGGAHLNLANRARQGSRCINRVPNMPFATGVCRGIEKRQPRDFLAELPLETQCVWRRCPELSSQCRLCC